MATLREAVTAFKNLLNEKQDKDLIRYALTGDGSNADDADVVGKPGWSWVRYDEKQDKASQVLNWQYPGAPQDIPIIVGKRYPTDKYYQVLGINLELYMQSVALGTLIQYILPKHGDTHTYGTGGDPAMINSGNILPGKTHETTPESLSVDVETFIFDNGGTLITWPGGTIDLTAQIPGVNRHRYVLVALVIATNSLIALPGTEVPLPAIPSLPTCPAGWIPLAMVLLADTTTEINEEDIYDYRILFSGVGGGYADMVTKAVGALEAEVEFQLAFLARRAFANWQAVVAEHQERDMILSTHIVEG